LSTRGVAARRSAGALYGWFTFPSPPEVLAKEGRRASEREGVHTTDTLPKQDIVVVDGIRTTHPVRTLIDLGSLLPHDEFEDVFDRAVLSGAVRRHRLETRAEALRAPRRRGAALVLRLLAERNPKLNKARSVWEARVLRLFDRAGAPAPRVNYPVR